MTGPLPIAEAMTSQKITRGTPAYKRLCLAMLLAGLSTFALLYCTQPLLPVFADEFGLTAEESSLAVSLATGPMAFVLLVAGVLSDRLGRRPIMIASLLAASVMTALLAALPDWYSLLAARFVCGLALAGVPAVAMTYISEEVEDGAVSHAMGLYIAGSAVGGMSGRLLVSLLTDFLDWRTALGLTGVAGLAMGAMFWRTLPPSRAFEPRPVSLTGYVGGFREVFADRALPWLFLLAFMFMGGFISIYNYVGFRLLAPPYSLGQSAVGAIFLLYLVGSASSAISGAASGRYGPRRSQWAPIVIFLAGIGLTAAEPLFVIVVGIAVVTAGFFGAHAIASSWVGRRAGHHRAQATACYLFCYYMGSSVLGSVGGYAWTHGGWMGVSMFAALLIALGLLVSLRLIRVKPLDRRPGEAIEEDPIPAD